MKTHLKAFIRWQSWLTGHSSSFTEVFLLLVFINCTSYSQTQYSCGDEKVYAYHKDKNTLCVAEEVVQAHLNHGDCLGTCKGSGCTQAIYGNGGEKTCSNPLVANWIIQKQSNKNYYR